MKRLRLMAAVVGCVVIVLAGVRSSSAELCDRVVAIVNDNVITLHELNKKIQEMTGLTPAQIKLRDKEDYQETRRKILEFLIDEKLARDKIKELGINVTERQVEAAIDKVKKDNHWTQEDLLERLKKEGLSYEKYKQRVKQNLEHIRLIEFEVKSKIIIREKMISQYYEKHKRDFLQGEKVHLAGIFLGLKEGKNPEKVRELYAKAQGLVERLRAGEDFVEMARRFSEGPGAEEGGDLGIFKVDQLEPGLRKVVTSLPEGGISDPIIVPAGIQIIKLVKKKGGKQRPLSEVRDAIYSILYQEEVNKRYNSWIKELRENSYTRIIF
ncbi:MAG: peptidylprolyl isomerase [Deltaproteobacteria bacterium]|nr:peptidylprolyl isomerase [Deltaproteobacteria bacterium]MBW1919046.1 peptidylprolyl isomerase [Deltaproteobacteria bacterium]MBW1934537.1 peptidylprolyl isomerase [Deltaproteobacteria bacterium]MBW1977019.1 peptidylprolyl isomerase [Deltaproteobacteria bacterium]MBW2044070.1 peptidylprolyl isomerase [Deltaproteobacteria bacterium]